MRRKKENKQEADKKGKERIKKFESRLDKKEENDDGIRSVLCYRKEEGGEWEPFNYTYRVSDSRPRRTKKPEPEGSGDDSESKD